ncbi:MAG: hypothetical protein KKB31_03205 [Nanoarchaeota archaeon]|nr:hypothetical protein [Nanoarchaeota archaeon]
MLNFEKLKQRALSKEDKSSKANQRFALNRPSVANPKEYWDYKIRALCESINSKEEYYTTSSCSGRVVLIEDEDKKGPGLFYFVSHDKITLKELKKELGRIKKGDVRFKQEPCILHVACKTLNDAQKLLKKAQSAGWKRSGIISSKEGFVCELMSTEKLEFPIISNGKILVGDDFLKIVIKKSNENLKKSWDNIWGLEKSI